MAPPEAARTAAGDPAGAVPPVAVEGELTGAAVGGGVIRGGAARISGLVVGNLAAFVSAALLVRVLSPGEFGQYATIMALLAIVLGASDAGLNVIGSRELALTTPGGERQRLVGAIVGLRALLAVLLGAAVLVFSLLRYGGPLGLGAALGGLAAVLLSTQAGYLTAATVAMRNGRVALAEITRQVSLAVCIGLVALIGGSVTGFLGAQLLGAVVLFVVTPLILGRDQIVWPRWDRARWSHLITVGLPVALAAIVSMIFIRLILLQASFLLSEEELGKFALAERVIEMSMAVPIALQATVLPVFSANFNADRTRAVNMVRLTSQAGLLVAGALVVAVAAGVPIVLTALGASGSKYSGTDVVLLIQCLALLPIFASQIWVAALIAAGERGRVLRSALTGLAIAAVLGAAGCVVGEARGAAAATVLAELALAVTIGVMLRRTTGRGSVVSKELLLVLLVTLTAVAVIAVTRYALDWSLPLVIVAGGLTFVLGVLFSGVVPDEVREQLRLRQRRDGAR